MPSEKSCGAVIFKANGKRKYLLLHYEGGHWDFVKGHIERGESERETVLRETREETGLTDVKFFEGYREPIGYYYKRAGKTVYKEVVFYLLEAKTNSIRLSREHVGFDWMSYDLASERLTFKNAKDTLRKAHEYLEKLPAQTLVGDAEKSGQNGPRAM